MEKRKESKENPIVPLHQQRQGDKDVFKKEQEQKERQLRMDFATTFGSPSGRKVLRWIMNQSGFAKSPIGGNPALGLDVDRGTLYNSARIALYSEIRYYVPHETLKQIEFEDINDILT